MSVNCIHIMGRLGADPEFQQGRTEKGDHVKFSVATDDGWGDNKKTNWHNVIFFGRAAEIIEERFRKGDTIAVTGVQHHDRVESDRGDMKYFSKIIGRDFSFCGGDGRDGGDRRESRRDDRDGRERERGRGRDDDRGRGRGRDDDRGRGRDRDDDRGRQRDDRDRRREDPNDEIPF